MFQEVSSPDQGFEALNTSLVSQNSAGLNENTFDPNRVLVSLLAEHLVYS